MRRSKARLTWEQESSCKKIDLKNRQGANILLLQLSTNNIAQWVDLSIQGPVDEQGTFACSTSTGANESSSTQ
jgi:hypothetical protein